LAFESDPVATRWILSAAAAAVDAVVVEVVIVAEWLALPHDIHAYFDVAFALLVLFRFIAVAAVSAAHARTRQFTQFVARHHFHVDIVQVIQASEVLVVVI